MEYREGYPKETGPLGRKKVSTTVRESNQVKVRQDKTVATTTCILMAMPIPST